MAEDLLRQQASNLRRSYNMQPMQGLNGTPRQSLTGPQQLDRILTGMGQVINSASNEIQRRDQAIPGTTIGQQQAGADQRARLRQLESQTDCETEACINRRLMASASPEQRERIKNLDRGPSRPTRGLVRSTQNGANSNGNSRRPGPGGYRGSTNWLNPGAGRPRNGG